jgi:dihydropyrimidine dehydrogenase (NAD+) subunit PreT
VKFLWNTQVTRIFGGEAVQAVELTNSVTMPVDLLVLAIGQAAQIGVSDKVQREHGRIVVDRATGQTSNPKYFSGGDCTNGGREVVDAVADGKRAGIGIAAWLEAARVQA